jgi:hydroxyacid-oxoacid transhydrogenase
VDALVDGAWPQQRVLKNAPRAVNRDELRELFRGAMAYW